ncbi:MAG: SRPBCC domain-containing protein [Streptosporangiaceae bacterium]
MRDIHGSAYEDMRIIDTRVIWLASSYDSRGRPAAMAYEVSTSIEIAATPENVWAVLADLASYPQWHPVFLSVTGQLAAGSKLTIRTTVPATGNPMTARVKVLTVEPGAELRWASKLLGITISKRSFLLSPSGGGTLMVQSATYRGLGGTRKGFRGGRIVNVIGSIQGTFEAINEVIKQQAEARQQAPG